MADRHALEIQLECDEQKLSLNEDAALALFRVAQEALNNAVRHSQAASVWVNLKQLAVRWDCLYATTGKDSTCSRSSADRPDWNERANASGRGRFPDHHRA
jgi:signal transduction histidine kinase